MTIFIYFSALISEYDKVIADTKRNEIKIETIGSIYLTLTSI